MPGPRSLAILLLVVSGCAKKASLPTAAELQATPELPSPESGSYARVADTPRDPVVARMVKGRTWDASLSGAASGLALRAAEGDGGLATWEVREVTWRAGYPYPVTEVRGWSTHRGAEPPQSLLDWIASIAPHEDLGLVRARGDKGDAWVGLRGAPRISVGVQPREVPLGGRLVLPPVPGASYMAVDPEGRVQAGSLDMEQRFLLDRQGEWLFEVRDSQGTAALFPVYADLVPPDQPLLDPGPLPHDDQALRDRLAEVMLDVRGAYGASEWVDDVYLQVAAESQLDGSAESLDDIARRTGVQAEQLWRLECRADSIEGCVDQLLWRPQNRSGMLAPSDLWGLAAKLDQGLVRAVALVASEPDGTR